MIKLLTGACIGVVGYLLLTRFGVAVGTPNGLATTGLMGTLGVAATGFVMGMVAKK